MFSLLNVLKVLGIPVFALSISKQKQKQRLNFKFLKALIPMILILTNDSLARPSESHCAALMNNLFN
jgi:hypothetical protein